MAKRGADKYLTDQNWDQEQDETEEDIYLLTQRKILKAKRRCAKGEFSAASTDVMKQRKILKAKRRCANGEADSASSTFKAFSGFNNESGIISAAACSSSSSSISDAQNPHFPMPLPSKNGNDSGSGKGLSAFNQGLLSWINEHVSKDADCDLTPALKSYCEQVEKLFGSKASGDQVSVEIETPAVDKKPESTDTNPLPPVSAVPLSELFKKSADTWDCAVCYVSNKNTDAKCVACTSNRPANAAPSAATPTAVKSQSVVGSSVQPSLADMFKKSSDEWECKGCWIRNKATASECVACSAKNPSAGVKLSEAESVSTTAVTTAPSFSFGQTAGFSFKSAESVGTTAVTAASSFSFAPKGGFSVNPAGGSLFSFGTNAVSSTSTSTSSFGFKVSSDENTGSSGVGFKFGTGLISSTLSQGFLTKPAGSVFAASEAKDEENEEYVPPKVESVAHTEEGAFYSVRCKLFYQKEGQWVERGLGNLFLKPSGERTQLLIRTDNSLGNILLNILLTSEMPVSRQGSNNLSLACLPNPPIESSKASKHPVCMLIRVKTGEMADELLAKINEHKNKH